MFRVGLKKAKEGNNNLPGPFLVRAGLRYCELRAARLRYGVVGNGAVLCCTSLSCTTHTRHGAFSKT